MDVRQLVEAAEQAAGRRTLAAELNMNPNRLSDWKAGSRRPDATEVLYLAARAGLEPEATLAEVMDSIDPRFNGLWNRMARRMRGQDCALCQPTKRAGRWLMNASAWPFHHIGTPLIHLGLRLHGYA